jgi:hypothetical protein
MTSLEQYKMATGFYDEEAIMRAAGVSERRARFADIFGDAQGTPDLGPDYNALLAEARRLNAEQYAALEAATEHEARAIVAKPEPWSRADWVRLTELGFASRYTEDGGEQGFMSTSYSLTERGEQLINPAYRAPGLYDDQIGIDG